MTANISSAIRATIPKIHPPTNNFLVRVEVFTKVDKCKSKVITLTIAVTIPMISIGTLNALLQW